MSALDTFSEALADEGLMVSAHLRTQESDALPPEMKSIALISFAADGWRFFSRSPEYQEGLKDPLDHWSRRVISHIAEVSDLLALFPFGGPPYYPFFDWALRSGQMWKSPVGMLVHRQAGLWISFRGALALPIDLPAPQAVLSPCLSCADQPCLRACPVDALTAAYYDTRACRSYLQSGAGKDCLDTGCFVRRDCPAGQQYPVNRGRMRFHMNAFLCSQ